MEAKHAPALPDVAVKPKRNTNILGHSKLFTPEVIDDIHIKAELGRYRMRGFSLFKKIPSWDDLTFLPGTLTRFVIEGYREKPARVVIVDDVCTTGASTIQAIEAAREFGFEIVGVMCLVEREATRRAATSVSAPVQWGGTTSCVYYVTINWGSDGIGLPPEGELLRAPPGATPPGSGLGTRLMRALAAQRYISCEGG